MKILDLNGLRTLLTALKDNVFAETTTILNQLLEAVGAVNSRIDGCDTSIAKNKEDIANIGQGLGVVSSDLNGRVVLLESSEKTIKTKISNIESKLESKVFDLSVFAGSLKRFNVNYWSGEYIALTKEDALDYLRASQISELGLPAPGFELEFKVINPNDAHLYGWEVYRYLNNLTGEDAIDDIDGWDIIEQPVWDYYE